MRRPVRTPAETVSGDTPKKLWHKSENTTVNGGTPLQMQAESMLEGSMPFRSRRPTNCRPYSSERRRESVESR